MSIVAESRTPLAPAPFKTTADKPVKFFTPAKPGTKIEGYNVLAEIGRGAASIIYLVQDPKTKQVWALKQVQLQGPKDQRFLEQAESEYEVSQKVRNPLIRHIDRIIKNRVRFVTVNEIILIMEYVDGVAVERHPPATFEQALDIFIQTARGLGHMHGCGYVHADMKPNNIVVNEKGQVKIIDLGQACPVGTVKERIQGTPDYIAPEQVHRREITPRTDIYNLGASMYWVLTQRYIPTALPKGDSLVGSLDDQFIEKPTPIEQLNPRVPKKLCDLVMKCVEVDPAKRPNSMFDVVEVLNQVREELRAANAAQTDGPGPEAEPGAAAASA